MAEREFSDDALAEGGGDAAQHEYNRAAIHCAHRITQFRRLAAEWRSAAEPAPEKLFPAFDRTGLGVALEYERMGNQPLPDALEEQARRLGVSFEHVGLTLGTVLHGIDLGKPLDPEETAFVRAVLLARKVIFFRDQHLSEAQHVAFARLFGPLDAFPFGATGENPFVLEIRHGPSSPGTENGWHTDVTWMARPSLGSIAQCIEVPPYGGDTLFSDSYAACLGLPAGVRERLEHLHGINDYRLFLGRGRGALPEDLVAELKARIPFGVSHPLLRTHPETGRTALYIHGGFLRHDSLHDPRTRERLPAEASERLVAQLLSQHGRPEYTCRFQWTPGAVAFWDNRAVQHYAASDYWPHARLLRRVTVAGDRPFYNPSREAQS